MQKEDLMAKFAMIEEELRKKDEDGKENIYALEKKAVIDKDRCICVSLCSEFLKYLLLV